MCKDLTFPTGSFELETTLQELKRRLSGAATQVHPITPLILRGMIAKLDLQKHADLAV